MTNVIDRDSELSFMEREREVVTEACKSPRDTIRAVSLSVLSRNVLHKDSLPTLLNKIGV